MNCERFISRFKDPFGCPFRASNCRIPSGPRTLSEAVYLRGSDYVNIKEIVLTVEGLEYPCPNCNVQIDDCECSCPYCAEVEECDCAIGHDKATGG